jgi:antitoxin (DNA-binding transcriptional repressor) of toxin-antitoxin stability system
MQTLTLQDAQSRLPELIDAAVSGEEVTITCNDGTIVALMLLKPVSPKPTFGSAKGLIKILDGFDDLDESAQLYAEDLELQDLTASAIDG